MGNVARLATIAVFGLSCAENSSAERTGDGGRVPRSDSDTTSTHAAPTTSALIADSGRTANEGDDGGVSASTMDSSDTNEDSMSEEATQSADSSIEPESPEVGPREAPTLLVDASANAGTGDDVRDASTDAVTGDDVRDATVGTANLGDAQANPMSEGSDAAPSASQCGEPTILLLIERSGSMFASTVPNGSSPSPVGPLDSADRWEAVRSAVEALAAEPLAARFGLMTYTGIANGECPVIQASDIEVSDDLGTLQQMLPASEDASLSEVGQSPMTEGLVSAYAWLHSIADSSPKQLFLITAGLGELCPFDLMNKGVWCGQDPAISAVQEAFANGITTRVFGVGGSSDSFENDARDRLLAGLAHAGAGLPVAPAPVDGLHCIQQESAIARGVEPANDFYANWRQYAAAEYGPDGMTYEDDLDFQLFQPQGANRLVEAASRVTACMMQDADQ